MSDRLTKILERSFGDLSLTIQNRDPTPQVEEVGRTVFVGQGIARVQGIPGVRNNEILRFPGDRFGLAFNLDESEVGVVLLDHPVGLRTGDEVGRTFRVLDVPVGESLLSRIVDGIGRPLDSLGPINASRRLPVERPAAGIMDRAPVTVPLQTGIKVVDGLIPIGRGQRELILGDRQTGKTAIAVDAIINQRGKGVRCIYCAIGQRSSSLARVVNDLKNFEAMPYTTVVATTEERPPGELFVAPYAAMSMAEHLMLQGQHVLIVFDDLTKHARAYRELSLLLRRPPGREAYPGDIFYIHSRLLERSTNLREELGGGSITALPIVETESQNMSAYIPTNLISITDGQVYLSPFLFDKGILPAVDVGKSVSRVGGKVQLDLLREEASNLRLAFSQFEELESFARFGTRLDDETKRSIERGRRIREILKQEQFAPKTMPEQIVALMTLNQGFFDDVKSSDVSGLERHFANTICQKSLILFKKLEIGTKLTATERASLVEIMANEKSVWLRGRN